MGNKYHRNQLLRVEIKSEAIFKEGKKGFVTYFRGGTDEMIIHDLKQLYPQFMNPDDHPVVNITPIKKKEYNFDRNTKRINEKQQLVNTRANVMKAEDYEDETLAD
jgi:hypothetical protein